MARSVVTVTPAWVQASALPCVLSLNTGLGQRVFINETASDVAAQAVILKDDFQFQQSLTKDTFVRGEADTTITLNLDEE